MPRCRRVWPRVTRLTLEVADEVRCAAHADGTRAVSDRAASTVRSDEPASLRYSVCVEIIVVRRLSSLCAVVLEAAAIDGGSGPVVVAVVERFLMKA